MGKRNEKDSLVLAEGSGLALLLLGTDSSTSLVLLPLLGTKRGRHADDAKVSDC